MLDDVEACGDFMTSAIEQGDKNPMPYQSHSKAFM